MLSQNLHFSIQRVKLQPPTGVNIADVQNIHFGAQDVVGVKHQVLGSVTQLISLDILDLLNLIKNSLPRYRVKLRKDITLQSGVDASEQLFV